MSNKGLKLGKYPSQQSNRNPMDEITNNYVFEKDIGEGTFGKVKLATHILTNEKVAIKILEKEKILEEDDLIRINREIKFLKKLRHDNVIKIFEIIENAKNFYIVMEYVTGGELFNFIVARKKLNDNEASFFFAQIINGIEYIHKNNIVHRDLKPENLLLNEQRILKIIDFGLSNQYRKDELLSTPCGSPCYAAPEMIQGKKYAGLLIDIWSTGITLYAMVCGFLPFEDKNNEKLYQKILECDLRFPSYVAESSKEMIKKLLIVNPDKRPRLEEIKNTSFYKKGMKLVEKETSIYCDSGLVNEQVYLHMNLMGFSKEEIVRSVELKKFNNIRTTYELLFNKIMLTKPCLLEDDYANYPGGSEKMHYSHRENRGERGESRGGNLSSITAADGKKYQININVMNKIDNININFKDNDTNYGQLINLKDKLPDALVKLKHKLNLKETRNTNQVLFTDPGISVGSGLTTVSGSDNNQIIFNENRNKIKKLREEAKAMKYGSVNVNTHTGTGAEIHPRMMTLNSLDYGEYDVLKTFSPKHTLEDALASGKKQPIVLNKKVDKEKIKHSIDLLEALDDNESDPSRNYYPISTAEKMRGKKVPIKLNTNPNVISHSEFKKRYDEIKLSSAYNGNTTKNSNLMSTITEEDKSPFFNMKSEFDKEKEKQDMRMTMYKPKQDHLKNSSIQGGTTSTQNTTGDRTTMQSVLNDFKTRVNNISMATHSKPQISFNPTNPLSSKINFYKENKDHLSMNTKPIAKHAEAKLKSPTNGITGKLIKPKLTLNDTFYTSTTKNNNSNKRKDEKKIQYVLTSPDEKTKTFEPLTTHYSKNKKQVEIIKPSKLSLHDIQLLNFDLKNSDYASFKEREQLNSRESQGIKTKSEVLRNMSVSKNGGSNRDSSMLKLEKFERHEDNNYLINSTAAKKPMVNFSCITIDNIKFTTEKLKKYCGSNRLILKEITQNNYECKLDNQNLIGIEVNRLSNNNVKFLKAFHLRGDERVTGETIGDLLAKMKN